MNSIHMSSMNTHNLSALCLAVIFALLFQACDSGSTGSGTAPELDSRMDSVSYGIGYVYGENMNSQGMTDLDLELMKRGIENALGGTESPLSQEQMQTLLSQYQMEAQQRAKQQQQQEGQQNLQKGEDFLAQNSQSDSVMVTDSGLQYQVLEQGEGISPDPSDSVRVHYEGELLDGTVFDSSYQRGEPVTFQLSGVIQGWIEGVQLMQEGAHYRFWIPAELGYGQNPPQGSPIGPNQTLVFEVELLEVVEN